MSDCILLVDDDLDITAAVAALLERPGRTIVICADVESAEIVLERFRVTHLVTDLQFSGAFGYEGLHFLGRIHARRPDCRIILMTGHGSDALRAEAMRSGAAAVITKPFGADELEAALGPTMVRIDEPARLVEVRSIGQILRMGAVRTHFQPIVRLGGDRSTFGFEALARVDGGWGAGGPDELFRYASRCSRLEELNFTSIESAAADAPQLPPGTALFLNVDPGVLESETFAQRFRSSLAQARVSLDRVVVEVTERSGFSATESALGVFDDLRSSGVRFALDDVGSAYSHLALLERIRPSFLKISNTFGTAWELDPVKRRIVRNLLSLAQDFDCQAILEGVETVDTANAATDLGIELGQGYLFGRPQPVSHWSEESERACA